MGGARLGRGGIRGKGLRPGGGGTDGWGGDSQETGGGARPEPQEGAGRGRGRGARGVPRRACAGRAAVPKCAGAGLKAMASVWRRRLRFVRSWGPRLSLRFHWSSKGRVVCLTCVAHVKPKFVLGLPCRLCALQQGSCGEARVAHAPPCLHGRKLLIRCSGPSGGDWVIERIPGKRIKIPESTP